MKQLFLMVNDGTVKLIETPFPTVKNNHVIVETMYSVVITNKVKIVKYHISLKSLIKNLLINTNDKC